MGVPGPESAGERGLALPQETGGTQYVVDLLVWDVGMCTLCYKLKKIQLACQPFKI